MSHHINRQVLRTHPLSTRYAGVQLYFFADLSTDTAIQSCFQLDSNFMTLDSVNQHIEVDYVCKLSENLGALVQLPQKESPDTLQPIIQIVQFNDFPGSDIPHPDEETKNQLIRLILEYWTEHLSKPTSSTSHSKTTTTSKQRSQTGQIKLIIPFINVKKPSTIVENEKLYTIENMYEAFTDEAIAKLKTKVRDTTEEDKIMIKYLKYKEPASNPLIIMPQNTKAALVHTFMEQVIPLKWTDTDLMPLHQTKEKPSKLQLQNLRGEPIATASIPADDQIQHNSSITLIPVPAVQFKFTTPNTSDTTDVRLTLIYKPFQKKYYLPYLTSSHTQQYDKCTKYTNTIKKLKKLPPIDKLHIKTQIIQQNTIHFDTTTIQNTFLNNTPTNNNIAQNALKLHLFNTL